jgi:anti-anti-sigma regulatory factor
MSHPSITVHTDTDRHVLSVHVAGPLVEAAHTLLLRDASPVGYGLLVNLSSVSHISDVGLDALRGIVRSATAQGRQAVFVCTELMMRTELVLADLDTLAPVVAADEQAVPLVSFAA